ncbi:lipid-A-disaccharide kinase [Salinimicrobium sediminis]|uniref:Tetraacyldisaccharide 4'-kinase n=1 Tax=Salinimicrobium sediminis TaxID=1343891 RepID=A0A285X781_9FLAO|nr:tetraacyldisaccharide 4'-kinase [Salinimicrobium sediminis]SOC80866.1 lipid-A-disaccharide kinase [Salinimicrobium sediminis]
MASARKLLFPFSILYGSIMHVRNKLYDKNLLSSREFEIPVIAVGNLSVGGTGKSPMVEYLVNLLRQDHKVATLSRGYKRKSSGYILLNGQDTAIEVGDEPLQFKSKFPDVLVAVDENRSNGIEKLLEEMQPPDVVILDDAYQHRKVKAGFYILLTSYTNLYKNDLVLPAGNLREPAAGAKRANIIVVTKCPEDLGAAEQEEIRKKLKPKAGQEVFFSSIAYSKEIYSRNRTLELKALQKEEFTLVTGIAKPQPLVDHLESLGLNFTHKAFSDHHNFTEEEIKALQHEELILTTEKDYMRLKNEISREKIFYLPIRTRFLSAGAEFESQVKNFVQKK